MATAQLNDFRDWIGPMLVKELRQGMRQKVFVLLFILLQAVLLTMMLLGTSSGQASGFFWAPVAILFVLLMPLRGVNAVSTEYRQNTLELLYLTRLNAPRIVFGKWAAIFGQTLLVAIALLPYIVMRYFTGGVDVAAELFALALVTIVSAALTAVTVGFSACGNMLIRAIVTFGLIIAAFFFVSVTVAVTSGEFSQILRLFGILGTSVVIWVSPAFWIFFGVLALLTVYAVFYMVDFGATFIAPDAENTSVRKRLLTLFVAGILSLLGLFKEIDISFVLGFIFLLLLFPWVDALSERPVGVRMMYEPWVRRGPVVRFFARFLYRGWPSGFLFFTFTAIPLFAWFLSINEDLGSNDGFYLLVSVFGSLLFPLLLLLTVFQTTTQGFVTYFFTALVSCLFGIIAAVAANNIFAIEGILWFFIWLPPVQFVMMASAIDNEISADVNSVGLVSILVNTIIWLFIFIRSLSHFRSVRKLEVIIEKDILAEKRAKNENARAEAEI